MFEILWMNKASICQLLVYKQQQENKSWIQKQIFSYNYVYNKNCQYFKQITNFEIVKAMNNA